MWTIFSFIAFSTLSMGVAFYLIRKDDLSGATGYFLGNRSLLGPVIAGSLLLTNISGEQLIGQSATGYTYSMQVMAFEVGAGVALIMLALWFLPKYLRLGIATIPELLELRFGPGMRKFTMFLFLFAYIFVYIPSILYTGAVSFATVFDLNTILNLDMFTTVILVVVFLSIVGIGYVLYGNLKLFAYTDTIFGVGLLIGTFAVTGYALWVLGQGDFSQGVNTIVTVHPEKLNSIADFNGLVPTAVLFSGMIVQHGFYWCTNQTLIQKTLASKNLVEGQKGAIYCGFLKLIGPFYMIIPGVVAYHLFPNIAPDTSYPLLVRTVLPVVFHGIFGAVFFGAIISSLNGFVNSASTIFTYDFYQFVKPNQESQRIVSIGKMFSILVIVVSGVLSPLYLLAPNGFYPVMQSLAGVFNVPIFVAVVVTLFTASVSLPGIVAATIVHFIIYFSYILLQPGFSYLYTTGLSLFASLLTSLVVSKFFPRDEAFFIPTHNFVNLDNWKHAKTASLILIVMIVSLYILFSPIGIVKI